MRIPYIVMLKCPKGGKPYWDQDQDQVKSASIASSTSVILSKATPALLNSASTCWLLSAVQQQDTLPLSLST